MAASANGNKGKVDCEDSSLRNHTINYFSVDLALRVLSLTLLVASLATTISSNQIKSFGDTAFSSESVSLEAKFTYSSAIIYFVVAVSVASLYLILTAVTSVMVISVQTPSTGLLFFLAFFDALMAGILASGTGATASIAYIGLKGNDHIGWTKVCDVFDKFCRHIGSAIAVSTASSIVLLLLVGLSAYSLHRRSH